VALAVGLGVALAVGAGVVGLGALPWATRVNCWWLAFVSAACSRRAPFSLDAPTTWSARPLARLTSLMRPDEPAATVNCCVAVPVLVTCVASEPEPVAIVRASPECRARTS
jgi:hypothetical protein